MTCRDRQTGPVPSSRLTFLSFISLIHKSNISQLAPKQTTNKTTIGATLHLYDGENLVVAQVLSLAVDEEVVELRDPQPQDPQGDVLHPRPVGHDAGGCDGVRDLLLVVGHVLPGADEEAEVGAVAGEQVWREFEEGERAKTRCRACIFHG